jgi:hypothetical protein
LLEGADGHQLLAEVHAMLFGEIQGQDASHDLGE